MKKLILLLIAALSLPFAARADQKLKRPNILYIIVDDQSPFDFKFYNQHSQLNAPVIEKWATEGMVIDGAYQMGAWVGGVCTASRHMIMSGRTVWHIPDRPFRKPPANPNALNPKLVPPNLVQNTLAAVFNRAGYATMRTCKRGNSYDGANKQFQVVHDATKRGGTAETGSAWHAERVLEYLNARELIEDADPFESNDATNDALPHELVNVPVLGIIENMSTYECPHCQQHSELFGQGGGEAIAKEYGIPLLAQLPLSAEISANANKADTRDLGLARMARNTAAQLSIQAKEYKNKFPEIVIENN